MLGGLFVLKVSHTLGNYCEQHYRTVTESTLAPGQFYLDAWPYSWRLRESRRSQTGKERPWERKATPQSIIPLLFLLSSH